MEKRKLLAAIMAVMMVISLLPSMVFASAPSGELAGKLKIKGLAAVGTTLSADYSKVEPAGLTDDDVTFQWLRKAEDAEGTEDVELGTDKTYVVTEEDLGSRIVLKITGKEEFALKGSLTAKTLEVSATEEEAKLLADQKAEEQENTEKTEEIEAVETEEQNQEEENSESDSAEIQETEEVYIETPEDPETPETEEPVEEEGGELQIYNEDEVILNVEEPDADSDEEKIPENLEEESGSETGYEENTEEQQKETEIIPSAVVLLDSDSEVMDFGTVTAGQETESQYAEISNTGNTELHFLPTSPEHFMVADISEPLAAGDSVNVWVVPREGLEPGQYEDTIQYSTEEGVVVSFTASVIVEAGKEEESPAEPAALSADPETLVFAALTEGYNKVEETQTVTITNIGKQTAVLQIPQSSYFLLTSLEGATEISLDAEAAAVFSVQPIVGLKSGTYSEDLIFGIQGQDTGSVSVQAQVSVEAKQEKPVVSVEAAPSALEKYLLKEGYEGAEPQTVTVTNTGNTAVVLEQPKAGYFSVGEMSATAIAPGENAQFTVQPAADLVAGIYNEEIQILGAIEGAEPQVLTNVLAQVDVEKAEETVYALSTSPAMVDFGKSKEGYEEAPKSQKVTVTNKGTGNITLEAPKSTNFKIGQLSQEVIAPGESSSFNIRPKTGLTEGLYVETILIPNNGGTTAQVDAQFEVTAAAEVVKLTGIQNPSEIEGIKNGAEKSVDGLKLPSYVIIKTTAGNMKASVKWNVSGCEYNPASKDAQTFKVNGTVVLPEKVQNPDELSLITSVKVTVGAGYTPKKADPADNKITGINSTGYTTQSKITFTAVGAGMENTSPRKGDERYLPTDWKVINTNSWQEAPYTATFGITKSGTYTLTVNFAHQKFDGNNWTSTGQKDAKQVNFTIDQAQVLSPTVTPIPRTTNQRNAVLTGDETNIMIFVVILVIAVGGIAGVLVYKKKRK